MNKLILVLLCFGSFANASTHTLCAPYGDYSREYQVCIKDMEITIQCEKETPPCEDSDDNDISCLTEFYCCQAIHGHSDRSIYKECN